SLLSDLRLALHALSVDPTEASTHRPENASRPDKLALSFGAALMAALEPLSAEFTETQVRALNSLALLLRDMSGAERAELWNEEALHSHPKWQEVRALAREALQQLDWAGHDA
ncbi:MAG: hypothetical protein ACREP8_02250, partial [Candidatus Binatia bacterium]